MCLLLGDAWRATGAGAGISIDAPPLPVPSGLAAGSHSGLARWIELASDGDRQAIAAALALIESPCESVEPYELMEALGEACLGIEADLKDADSVAACDKHGIAMLFTGVRHFRH